MSLVVVQLWDDRKKEWDTITKPLNPEREQDQLTIDAYTKDPNYRGVTRVVPFTLLGVVPQESRS
jgi:hypothetical protein